MQRTCSTCSGMRHGPAPAYLLLFAEGSDRVQPGSDADRRALLPPLETSDLMHAGRSSESSGEDGSSSSGSGCGGGRHDCRRTVHISSGTSGGLCGQFRTLRHAVVAHALRQFHANGSCRQQFGVESQSDCLCSVNLLSHSVSLVSQLQPVSAFRGLEKRIAPSTFTDLFQSIH